MKYMGTLLAVQDMERSKQFYREVLGLEVLADFGANVMMTGGLFLQTGETWKNFIRKTPQEILYGNCTTELYYEETDMDGFLKKLRSFPDIAYIHEPLEHSWGQWGVRFCDPDAHIIEVSESLPAVIGRFIRSGMSPEETAERMDVRVEYILEHMPAEEATAEPMETERLLLRAVTEQDAEAIFAYSREPNVGPNAGWKPHESIEETRDIMELMFLKQKHTFAILRKADGKLVGTIGIVPDPKRENEKAGMLGYALSEMCWGQGIMTEAVHAVVRHGFRNMGLNLLSAYCFPDNARSRRVLEKCGFGYEGRLQSCEVSWDGRTLDHDCYIARPSWDL